MTYPYYNVNTTMNSGFRPESNRVVPIPGDPNYDRWWEEQNRAREEARRREEGRNPTTVPEGPQAPGGPDLSSWPFAETNTTQSDIAAAMKAFGYEGVFMNLLGQFGGYQNRAFDVWENIMGRALDENGRVGADYAGASAAAQEMASGASGIFFGGNAARPGSFQNMAQKAFESVGQSNFTASGEIPRALQQAATEGGNIFTQAYYQAIPGLLNADVAMKTAYLNSANQGLANFTQSMLGAAEGASSMGIYGAELPYQRSLSRTDTSIQNQLLPYIKLGMAQSTKSWGEKELEGAGSQLIDLFISDIGEDVLDLAGQGISAGWDWLTGVIGGGDDGGPDLSGNGGYGGFGDPYGQGDWDYSTGYFPGTRRW